VLLVVLVVRIGVPALEERVVRHSLQRASDARKVVVDLRGRFRFAGDDQRRPRLIDQDRVDLIHDRVRMAALHDAVKADRHIVAQIVEAELGVRPVCDVALVGDLALGERHHVLDRADGHAETLEDAAVPLGVTLGEVVVGRDEVNSLVGQRIQVEREARDERLALTGLHLRHVAFMEHDAAHQLDVEHPLVGLPQTGLPDGRKGLEQQLLERLAVLEPLPELDRLVPERVVRKRSELGLDRGDVGSLLGQPLHAAALADAEYLLEGSELGGHGT
jgi:hypothetical protein